MPQRQQSEAEPRVFHQNADEYTDRQQADGDDRIITGIRELQIRGRRLAMHRQRDFLEAEILHEVEYRQRIREHRQREVMAAKAEVGVPMMTAAIAPATTPSGMPSQGVRFQ